MRCWIRVREDSMSWTKMHRYSDTFQFVWRLSILMLVIQLSFVQDKKSIFVSVDSTPPCGRLSVCPLWMPT